MGAFRKSAKTKYRVPEGSEPIVTIPVSKTVSTPENPEPTVYVEMKKLSVDDYSKSLGLPRDEDYQLRDMIASGRIPEEVPVSGILDSNDPLDLSNVGREDALMERLNAAVDSSKPAPAPAPESNPQPSNVE